MALEKIHGGNDTGLPTGGVGYIVIPENADQQEYIKRCYRNHTVSISGGIGTSYIHNVKIAEDCLQKIQFPSGDEEFGSSVVWIREGFYHKPVIVAILRGGGNRNAGLLDEYQQRIVQQVANQVVEVFLDAGNALLNISALGGVNNPSRVSIKASSGAAEGDAVNVESKDEINQACRKHKVNVSERFDLILNNGIDPEDGEEKDIINIHGDKDEFHYKDHYGNEGYMNKDENVFTDQFGNKITSNADETKIEDHFGNTFVVNADETHYTDQFGNETILNEDNVQILTSKLNVGQGNEQMVLGNTLVDLLGQMIDAITSMTVVTHVGPSGTPINAAQFTAIKAKLETALSKLSNTD